MRRLQDKNAVITGAATGIGAATATLFAAEGARVIIADINESAASATVDRINSAGGDASFIYADVSKSADIKYLVETTTHRLGRIDVLHNNAACFDAAVPLIETSEATWDKTMDVNLKSIYLTCRAVIPLMLEEGRGVILNTASVLSAVGADSFAAYIASKGGVAQLTRSIAVDYGRRGIRANALCPGITASEIAQKTLDVPAQQKSLIDKTVLGRVAKPIEIANAALFLVSDESSYITGTCLFVDGGWTCI